MVKLGLCSYTAHKNSASIVGRAQKYTCRGYIFVHLSSAKDVTVVGRPQGIFLVLYSAKIICHHCSKPHCLTPCSAPCISKSLCCPFSKGWAILIKLGQEKSCSIYLPKKITVCGMAAMEPETRGLLMVKALVKPSLISGL